MKNKSGIISSENNYMKKNVLSFNNKAYTIRVGFAPFLFLNTHSISFLVFLFSFLTLFCGRSHPPETLIRILMMIQTGHTNLILSPSFLLVIFFLPSPSFLPSILPSPFLSPSLFPLHSSPHSIPSLLLPPPLSFLPSLPFLSLPSSFFPFLLNSLPSLLSFLPSLTPN